MNKIFAYGFMILLMVACVVATPSSPSPEEVRVEAKAPGALQNVTVTIQTLQGSTWQTVVPSYTTDNNGKTDKWNLMAGTQVKVLSAVKTGYTCDTGATFTVVKNQKPFKINCVKDTPQVPEFGAVAGAVALIGAMGLIFIARRN